MDECLERLIDRIESGEDLKILIPSERISTLIRFRLEMQAPFISKWPQALSIQVLSIVYHFYDLVVCQSLKTRKLAEYV